MTIKQLIHRYLVPAWATDHTPDAMHPHKRRFTAVYRRKQGVVKNLWIGCGLVMIVLQASPPLVFALAMATMFLSFAILDETD